MNSLDLNDVKVGVLFIKAHCHFFRDTAGMEKIKQELLHLFAEASIVVKTKVLIKELVAVCSDPCSSEEKVASAFKQRIRRLSSNEAHRIRMSSVE